MVDALSADEAAFEDDDLSPLEWLHELEEQIKEQREHAELYEPYYTNARELQIVRDEYESVFGSRDLQPPRTNLSSVGVNATAERLRVQSFRVGLPAADDAPDETAAGDAAAEELWLRNDLDVMQSIAFVETLVKARTFGLVWPDHRTDDIRAVMTIEDPEQFAVARSAMPPYDVVAACKIYETRAGAEVARVWTREGLTIFTAGGRGSGELWTPPSRTKVTRSRWRERQFHSAPKPWRGKVVPAVEFANRQRLLTDPTSHLVDVAPIADSHSKVLADLVIACSFGAVPIRTATGITVVRDREGNPKAGIDVRADRMMVSEKESAKFGTLPAADLAGYAKALEILLAQVRIVTRVPSHYYGEGTSSGLAGETIKASEGSLVRLVKGMQDPFGHSLRTYMRLGLQLENDRYADAPIRVRWTDTETRVESQMTDAAQKLDTMGVPLKIILEEYLKQDPATVAEALRLKDLERERAEAMLAALNHDVDLPGRQAATAPAEPDADELQKRANAFGTLYRSGVEAREAARIVGLDLKKHSGLLPVTLQRSD